MVVIDGEILGKPAGSADAARMLDLLADREHQVLTGICLRRGVEIVIDCARTRVWFTPLMREEIAEYVASGEPMDKAGAYAIQGRAAGMVRGIEGSYTNIVGLPLCETLETLARMGAI